MNARKLRWILSGVVIIVITLNIAGFSLLSKVLSQKSQATDHALIDAEIAKDNTTQLQRLQSQLASSSALVSKAQQLVGTQAEYKYQDQAISDLNQLAKTYGIRIASYSFGDPTKPVTPVTGAAATAAKPLPKGVKQVPVTLSISGSVSYDNYLKFLRALELNLTRLQVTGVNFVPTPTPVGNITNSDLTIQLYVRR